MHQVEAGKSTEYVEESDSGAQNDDQFNTIDRNTYDPSEYLYPITEVHKVDKPLAITRVLLENAKKVWKQITVLADTGIRMSCMFLEDFLAFGFARSELGVSQIH